MAEERLQKVMAGAGVASRRASEAMIEAGRVTVDGVTITKLGTKVDPEEVKIAVDGRVIEMQSSFSYVKLHKPRGVISDVGGDTRGRETVAELLPDDAGRLYPVGRLDLNSEGLVLMTDDGQLAHRLTHPRFEHPKTYFVLIGGRPSEPALRRLRSGVVIEEDQFVRAEARILSGLPEEISLMPGPLKGVWLEVLLREGKKRQIRHMTAAIGHPTMRLIRWSIGPLTLGSLGAGQSMPLSKGEIAALKESVQPGRKARQPTSSPKRRASGRGKSDGPTNRTPKRGSDHSNRRNFRRRPKSGS